MFFPIFSGIISKPGRVPTNSPWIVGARCPRPSSVSIHAPARGAIPRSSFPDAVFKVAVHPHMRGERMAGWLIDITTAGSSPHAWGTRPVYKSIGLATRFIPTCVGNAYNRPLQPADEPVHPHMRGERGNTGAASAFSSGSSPHAWGTLYETLSPPIEKRFIPTCVGNADIAREIGVSRSVHPHMRGERLP